MIVIRERNIGIGLLGLGTIGAGVVEILAQKSASYEKNLGFSIELIKILVADANKTRDIQTNAKITADFLDLIDDPKIDLIVEAIGGETPAFEYIRKAIDSGKHVVTANKEVIAKYGPELIKHAVDNGVSIRFEASVGGGIPILRPLSRDLLANDFNKITTIINGTTNYMLTRMSLQNANYSAALEKSKSLGYAEPDPTADVEGIDAAYKLAILSSLAFKVRVRFEEVYAEGISNLDLADFVYAKELGYVVKLLAIAEKFDDGIQVRVHPSFVPMEHPLAKVNGVQNAIQLSGDLVGSVILEGPGAGKSPTASAIIGDIFETAEAIFEQKKLPPYPFGGNSAKIQHIDLLHSQYYLRIKVKDQPGVMAEISRALGDRDVSLASVIQKDLAVLDGSTEIVVTTHSALEASVRGAIASIRAQDAVIDVFNLIRIEEVIA